MVVARMAKIRNPARFSESFKVDASSLDRAGVLNPTLNADTRLFIEPITARSQLAFGDVYSRTTGVLNTLQECDSASSRCQT